MKPLSNTPKIVMGLVAVSRDCFRAELARNRLNRVVAACEEADVNIVPCNTIIETERDAMAAVDEMRSKGVNAVTIYLGNFGPEGPTTIFAKKLGVPFMLVGAAEESKDSLIEGRGDAYCGMLNASLNCGLRHLRPFIPRRPVGMAEDIARAIAHFANVARVVVGVRNVKVFAFGPRPQDFYACNAPIGPLYDLDVEVMENSELDLLEHYKSVANRTAEIESVARDMAEELGAGNTHPEKLRDIAQLEVALTTFFDENLGSRQFGLFANKCWPSFEPAFGFTPCYVNSRLASRGIPAACEVDLYGALSEYMIQCAARQPATLLDINNTVPADLKVADMQHAKREDLFMGFHCGNTPACMLCAGFAMKYQLIMHRLMEPGREPNITCGTLEGRLRPGATSIFRLQGTPHGRLQSYVAQGHILDTDPRSFGSIGIFAIPGMARFYRYVLLEKRFPHHAGIAFDHVGETLWDATRLLGVTDIHAPKPAGVLYEGENPFEG